MRKHRVCPLTFVWNDCSIVKIYSFVGEKKTFLNIYFNVFMHHKDTTEGTGLIKDLY